MIIKDDKINIETIINILLTEENIVIENNKIDDFLFINKISFLQKSYFWEFLDKKRNIIIKNKIYKEVIDIRIQPYLEVLYYHNLIYFNFLINTYHFYKFKDYISLDILPEQKLFLLKKQFNEKALKKIRNFIISEMELFLFNINNIFYTRLYSNPYIGEMYEKLTEYYIFHFNSSKKEILKFKNKIAKEIKIN